MFRDMKELFKDDYKRIGKYIVRPFSVMWWILIGLQSLTGVLFFYTFYVVLWFFLA